MSIAFTIAGTTFDHPPSTMAVGAYALFFQAGAYQHDVIRHHVPGADGNFVSFQGGTGRQVIVGIRYLNGLANGILAAAAHSLAWVDAHFVPVVTPPGAGVTHGTFTRCVFTGGRVLQHTPAGRGLTDGGGNPLMVLDMEYTFTTES